MGTSRGKRIGKKRLKLLVDSNRKITTYYHKSSLKVPIVTTGLFRTLKKSIERPRSETRSLLHVESSSDAGLALARFGCALLSVARRSKKAEAAFNYFINTVVKVKVRLTRDTHADEPIQLPYSHHQDIASHPYWSQDDWTSDTSVDTAAFTPPARLDKTSKHFSTKYFATKGTCLISKGAKNGSLIEYTRDGSLSVKNCISQTAFQTLVIKKQITSPYTLDIGGLVLMPSATDISFGALSEDGSVEVVSDANGTPRVKLKENPQNNARLCVYVCTNSLLKMG